MKIGITNYSQMNTYYLMELYRERTRTSNEQILKEIDKRFHKMHIQELLKKWSKEKNITLKEMLEVTVSERIARYEPIIEYDLYPEIFKQFIEQVTSIDALCILMNMHNKTIRTEASNKYKEFIKEYLELTDNQELYKTEGNDYNLYLQELNNIIEFPIEKVSNNNETKETAKIYKFIKKEKEK